MDIRDLLQTLDPTPTIYSARAFGRNINRTEIEEAITEAGYSLPTKNILFYIVDDDSKAYLVRYFSQIDKYGIEKLGMR